MKTQTEMRIEKMRNGEKIKCPRCEGGFFSAVGDPKTTNVFRCDTCQTGMTLTIPYTKIQK
jgi:DNA-directed RNA polymerase subunit RPC12/RpoP